MQRTIRIFLTKVATSSGRLRRLPRGTGATPTATTRSPDPSLPVVEGTTAVVSSLRLYGAT